MSEEISRSPKFLENSLLGVVVFLAASPLYYQLKRWDLGLDPTFVHPSWIDTSPLPFVLYMAKIHPIIWMAIALGSLFRIFYNYGWKLER